MKSSFRKSALMAPIMAGTMLALVPSMAVAGDNAEKAERAMARENADKAVSYAERAVVEQPRDPAMRVLLGQAYLKAGRMVSARESLAAAVELGDASGRTALMLALAQVGSGEPRLAVGTINMQGSAIPAADRGLALALAGETARGVEILAADIRAGNNTSKLRQNLAYAFALDGRWREARAMAAQDVPANEIGDRMTEWAQNARPDLYAQRVAALMGAEAVSDKGMPQHLALSNSAPPMPAAVPASKPAPVMAAAKPEPKPAPVMVAEAPVAPAAPATQAAKPAAPAAPRQIALAVIQPVPSENAAEKPVAKPSSAAKPTPVVVAALPASRAAPAPAPAPAPAAKPEPKPARVAAVPAAKPAAAKPALPAVGASGTHIAQLGSYASVDAANAGWKVFQARYNNLRGAKPVITKAVVDGKDYWRVAAGGFDEKGAYAMCKAVKASGNGCLPIAQANSLGGKATAAKPRLAKAD